MHDIEISKFLSLVLRHKPETIGLTLDSNGWADINELISKMNQHDFHLTFDQLEIVVENSDKKRFAFSSDLTKIRANQGHSVTVDLELEDKRPPDIIYHGTAKRNIESIKQQGLLKGQRHHVHLSIDTETARKVGMRYGEPIILQIDSKQMFEKGIRFYLSENGVWLTDYVSPQYIKFFMILNLWEDDYLMIEMLPNENLDFIINETRRICDFGDEHFDGSGYTEITPIGEKPVKTIEKLINISEVHALLIESGLEKIDKFYMQDVGLLEGKDVPIGYGTKDFAIMCNEQNGLLEDIWVNNFPKDVEDQLRFKKALQLIGQKFNLILVDWFKCEYYNLTERASIEELIKKQQLIE